MNESELLFTELLDCDRLSLYLNRNVKLNKDSLSVISSILKRRISGEPIQYILGRTEFMGLEFKIKPDVFIPRPETEILVETAIKIVYPLTRHRQMAGCRQRRHLPVNPLTILDIGTGSGCIAVSLAKLLSNVKITATDISEKAIEVAQYNAALNNIIDEIRFVRSDLFTSYELRVTSYNMIISNPPYIPTPEIKNLQLEVKCEPTIALDGGRDGLDFYRKIITDALDYLTEGGFLIMEMGFSQKEKIENIFKRAKTFQIIEIIRDYNNIDRVIVAQKKTIWIN